MQYLTQLSTNQQSTSYSNAGELLSISVATYDWYLITYGLSTACRMRLMPTERSGSGWRMFRAETALQTSGYTLFLAPCLLGFTVVVLLLCVSGRLNWSSPVGTVFDMHVVRQGMDFTTDKLRSLVRKWQTLIEAHVEVKTTDGYVLRMFCIGFTKKRAGQVLLHCSARAFSGIACMDM